MAGNEVGKGVWRWVLVMGDTQGVGGQAGYTESPAFLCGVTRLHRRLHGLGR